MRHTVRHRIGRRGGHGTRTPSKNPAHHDLSPDSGGRWASVYAAQVAR